MKVPVIAAVHGRGAAGGCGLASACDLVLASASARFGYPEVKIGFVPAMVLAILRRNVSEKHAFELITRAPRLAPKKPNSSGSSITSSPMRTLKRKSVLTLVGLKK